MSHSLIENQLLFETVPLKAVSEICLWNHRVLAEDSTEDETSQFLLSIVAIPQQGEPQVWAYSDLQLLRGVVLYAVWAGGTMGVPLLPAVGTLGKRVWQARVCFCQQLLLAGCWGDSQASTAAAAAALTDSLRMGKGWVHQPRRLHCLCTYSMQSALLAIVNGGPGNDSPIVL